MNGPGAVSLASLCGRVRPELAALGDLGAPLVDVLGVVELTGGGRGVDVLADPGFALDILTAASGSVDASVVGRVLDFLRVRVSSPVAGLGVVTGPERVTLATAIERFEAGPLKRLSAGTQNNYRTWTRRLSAKHGDSDPQTVTTGDLSDLIAEWLVTIRKNQEKHRRRHWDGRGAEKLAVVAFRTLWRYMFEKRWVYENVAAALVKPAAVESQRRPWLAEEAALIRQFARSRGRDGLLDEVMISIPERMGLRREESYKLRICDVDLTRRRAQVMGKGGRPREVAIPPVLALLLARYLEDRRPSDVPSDLWLRSDEYLLRTRPSLGHPHGQRAGWGRPDAFWKALRKVAPDLFRGDAEQSLHCYRHSLGTWVERRFGRKATRAILGHRGLQESTDRYVHVTMEERAEILAEYEQYLLAGDPTYPQVA